MTYKNCLAQIVVAVTMAATTAGAQNADLPPSKWGRDDALGSANYLSAERALRATDLVTEGRVYGLGMEIGPETPGVSPRFIELLIQTPGQYGGQVLAGNRVNYLDDVFIGSLGMGTQLDGLGHVGIENTFYNGRDVGDFVTSTGITELGIEDIPPMVTRGILLDVAGHRGVDRLGAGESIGSEEIQAIATAQGVSIEEGDVVILNTGWLSLVGVDNELFSSGEPGLNVEGADFLVSKGVVAVGTDTWGTEVVPFEDPKDLFPVHAHLLTKSGTYLLQNVQTSELAADKVYEFMFALGQPRLKGAVQVFVNPIAIR